MPKAMKKQLDIVMLGHKRIPSREGGIEVVVEQLAVRMAAAGHRVTCLNRAARHGGERRPEYQGVRLKTVPTLDGKGIAALTASVTGAIAAAFGPCDVVHFHAEGPCIMLWLPRLLGKRCIATVHGLDHRRGKWGKTARTVIRLGEKCAVKYAHEIIVLSDGARRYFWDTYGRETKVIPNGISRPARREARKITEQLQLKKNDYILYLGRLVPEKGITCLIEAFAGLDTDKKLVIAGHSADSDGYAELLREKAAGDSRVLFTGFVEGQLLEELYSNAFAYVLPSELEGMPMSLLEAMSYGNCCVTSDIEECAAVVGEHGVTFPKGDAAALRGVLQFLCGHPEAAARYRLDAADYIIKRFPWETVVEKTLMLYSGGVKKRTDEDFNGE